MKLKVRKRRIETEGVPLYFARCWADPTDDEKQQWERYGVQPLVDLIYEFFDQDLLDTDAKQSFLEFQSTDGMLFQVTPNAWDIHNAVHQLEKAADRLDDYWALAEQFKLSSEAEE